MDQAQVGDPACATAVGHTWVMAHPGHGQVSLLGEESATPADAPLADRMRPRALDEVIGQPELTAPGSPLRAALDAGEPRSLILWGPPGVGKTTIARAIARQSDAAFEQLNAVTDGIKELRAVIERAQHRRTLLFIDEIARWNKSQQDALLPHVESGRVILIGATTEQPGREINNALMSRLKLFTLRALDEAALSEIADRALADSERGLGGQGLTLATEAREHILLVADGDARAVLNGLEAAAVLLPRGGEITLEVAQQATGSRRLAHDKAGEQHYDLISALIKSIRGSSVDGSLYWLARLEAGGEDPAFVARRLVVSASEEVGLAAPGALAIAVAGYEAVKNIGPPECWINLAAVTAYLARAPKSWAAYEGWRAAQELVAERPAYRVPDQLRNATTAIDRAAGAGRGYVHASQAGGERVRFLPAELDGVRVFSE
ncbi:MAG: replication-associated recombination protein A [Solirubrobacteraceae bacterium]